MLGLGYPHEPFQSGHYRAGKGRKCHRNNRQAGSVSVTDLAFVRGRSGRSHAWSYDFVEDQTEDN